MAQEPGQEKSLEQLRQEIAHSRDRLARDLTGLRYELNFPLKFKKSFQRKTSIWVAAAAVVGVMFSVLPSRTKKVYVKAKGSDGEERRKKGILEAGFALGAVKIAVNLLRPVLIRFVTNKLSGAGAGRRAAPKW